MRTYVIARDQVLTEKRLKPEVTIMIHGFGRKEEKYLLINVTMEEINFISTKTKAK